MVALETKTAEIMAIIAAALFPLGLVSLRKGYDHSSPLFATVYGYLFLKQHEKITLHVVLGAVTVVTGIVLIAAF